MYSKETSKNRQLATEEYLNTLEPSLVQLSKKYKISRGKWTTWMVEQGIAVINHQNKDKFNTRIFQTIDTEEKAYWLGFLFADGAVSKSNNSVELSLGLKDIMHLKKFAEFIGLGNRIKQDTFRCRFCVSSKLLKQDLINHGCTPRKSLSLKFPNNIRPELIAHFIRGYFDGDGCFYNVKRAKGKGLGFSILGTKEFINSLMQHINLDFKLNKDKRHLGNTFSIGTTGNKAILIGDYIYSNASILLERKYNKYIICK